MPQVPKNLGNGGSQLFKLQELLDAGATDLATLAAAVLAALGNLKFTLVAGTTATTNIAVTGILTTDAILFVLHNTAGTFADVTAEASITSNGNVQLGSTDTSGDQLVIVWHDKPAAPTVTLTASE